ncbi:hypothetical protein FGG08_001007 [Glutinoglossum americanum]|uniref:Histone acetyltransferase type B catalytic subunit n=1 Tax=Glutinoglossum americanum TaxID=1670608 RepID=A0A9P8IFM7_9PEZI|nr:hypothetical protein FGG08_001007 [Glutinoglossum americanum]
MSGPDEWSANANKAVTISLIQQGAAAPLEIANFCPKFTYPIFGQEEQIFGYQNLSIHLRFTAHDLLPNLEVTWDQKFKTIGDVKADDIEGTLRDWLSPSMSRFVLETRGLANLIHQAAFGKTLSYLSDIQDDGAGDLFKPPGEKITSYKIKDQRFEVWRGRLVDPAVRRILGRIQIFIPFFIEGGSFLNLEEQEFSLERWSIFFLYEKLSHKPLPHSSTYSFIGYSTAYRYYFYDQDTPQTLTLTTSKAYPKQAPFDFILPIQTPPHHPSRERISQFLILPPYQSQGHGSRFYGALVKDFLANPIIKEITVEDPNEAFDDLRDFCDLKRLRENGTFEHIKINTNLSMPRHGKLPTSKIIDKALLQQQRIHNKIAPRQFDRLVEMHLLSTVSAKNRKASSLAGGWGEYDFWRLLVKQRLYKFNRQSLAQLDLPERIDKLEEVFEGVESDYLRLLRGLERGEDEEPDTHEGRAADDKVANGNKGKKRAIEESEDEETENDDDDDNDDSDGYDDHMEGIERPAKRSKGWR